jgi:prefoldin subunit 5
MTDLTELRDVMRDGFAALRDELGTVRARVDGVPLIRSAIEGLRQDIRMMRAAINDMARVNITAGEVEALHTELDRLHTKQVEIEARVATLERLAK